MKNISFVLWILLYPVASELTSLIAARVEQIRGIQPKKYEKETEIVNAVLSFGLWIAIAGLLYER